MPDDYIPQKDAEALTFMNSLVENIGEDPARYFMSQADWEALKAAVEEFAAAYADAKNPQTRGPLTVSLKDQTRNSAEQIIRQYAKLIKYNGGISDQDKQALGIRPENHTRTPIDVPTTQPVLNIVGATSRSHTVRAVDQNTPETGKRPYGYAALQLFVHIGDEPIGTAEEARFYGSFTRNPIGVAFDAADRGKTVTYFARWQNTKGETGPWSLPASMSIAA